MASQASSALCSSVYIQYNTRTLLLPCIILNTNRRTQNGGGLGTRLANGHVVKNRLGQDSPNFCIATHAYSSFI